MGDIVDVTTRSRMMAGIKNKNTKPEMIIRRALHRRGYRYRLHVTVLPSKPDIVFRQRRAVIMINGCFWHGHNCPLFKWPSSRQEFWQQKISRTREKDFENRINLRQQGWRVLTIWECALRGRTRWSEDKLINLTVKWLDNEHDDLELRGNYDGNT